MMCPNCGFVEKDEVFGDPATCPKCNAIYEKALRVKALRDQLESQKPAKNKLTPNAEQSGATLKDRLASATTSVREGRQRRAEHETEVQQSHERQKVVIADIDMPFWSMVMFMVKWAIASIPAIIILVLIATGIPAFFGTLFKMLL